MPGRGSSIQITIHISALILMTGSPKVPPLGTFLQQLHQLQRGQFLEPEGLVLYPPGLSNNREDWRTSKGLQNLVGVAKEGDQNPQPNGLHYPALPHHSLLPAPLPLPGPACFFFMALPITFTLSPPCLAVRHFGVEVILSAILKPRGKRDARYRLFLGSLGTGRAGWVWTHSHAAWTPCFVYL